jgi:hypothetical protein
MPEEHKRRNDDTWHVGKSIDVSHILATLVIAVGGFMYVSEMKTDIEVLKSQETVSKDFIQEIRADVKEIRRLLVNK